MPYLGNLLQHILFIYFLIKKTTTEISRTNIIYLSFFSPNKPLLVLLNHTSKSISKKIRSSRLGLQEMRIRFIYIFLKRAWTRYCLDYFVNQDTEGTFAKKKNGPHKIQSFPKIKKKKKKSNQTYMIILKLIHYHIIKAMAVYNIIQNHYTKP